MISPLHPQIILQCFLTRALQAICRVGSLLQPLQRQQRPLLEWPLPLSDPCTVISRASISRAAGWQPLHRLQHGFSLLVVCSRSHVVASSETAASRSMESQPTQLKRRRDVSRQRLHYRFCLKRACGMTKCRLTRGWTACRGCWKTQYTTGAAC